MHIVIRADGNKEVAMGHVMRCLSIGEALKSRGMDVTFVTAGEDTREIIEKKGFFNYVLNTDFSHMEGEIPAFAEYLKEKPADLILVDSYYATYGYMESLHEIGKTAWLDDMGEQAFPVDVLINYNNYGSEIAYKAMYQKKGIDVPMLLTGCMYAPLREEFQKGEESRFRDKVQDVLISTGGGDKAGIAVKLCKRLLMEKQKGLHTDIRYHIICGPFFGQREELGRLLQENREFVIHENVTNMSEIMKDCDAAVSAAGSTMYELCSMRLPAVCFVFAKNQCRMAECFQRTTEIQNAGNVTENEDNVLDCLLLRLYELETDGELRKRIRKQMEALTDAKGAGRIGDSLGLFLEKKA